MFASKSASPELDDAIAKLFTALEDIQPETEQYGVVADQLSKLMKLKKEMDSSSRISPDVLATVTANLLGILLILQHEKIHVIGSKALSFVMKMR